MLAPIDDSVALGAWMEVVDHDGFANPKVECDKITNAKILIVGCGRARVTL